MQEQVGATQVHRKPTRRWANGTHVRNCGLPACKENLRDEDLCTRAGSNGRTRACLENVRSSTEIFR